MTKRFELICVVEPATRPDLDGVHLIPLGRYREVAHRVEQLLAV